jgi:hypothetical protein
VNSEPPLEAPPIDWEAMARAFVHPLKISILEVLAIDGGRTLSPNQMAYELQMPLGNVSFHVEKLRDQRFLDEVNSEPVRGALEHFYRARTM